MVFSAFRSLTELLRSQLSRPGHDAPRVGGYAEEGKVRMVSSSTEISAGTSFKIQHAYSDVLTVDATGSAFTDDNFQVTASTHVAITAGDTFSVSQGTDPAVITIGQLDWSTDSTGTRVTDSQIYVTGTGHESCTSTRTSDSLVTLYDVTNCDLTAGTPGTCAVASASSGLHSCAHLWRGVQITGGGPGTEFMDMTTLHAGLTLTAGPVAVTSDGSISLHADVDATYDATNALHLQNGAANVLTIDTSGTTLTDDAITVTSTGSTIINAQVAFIVTNGIVPQPPTLRIDAAGSSITNTDAITLTARNALLISGGTAGSTFLDHVTMNAGLHLAAGAVLLTSDSYVTITATNDLVLQADRDMKIQHGADDVLIVSAAGTTLQDDAVRVAGSATVAVTAETIFSVTHGAAATSGSYTGTFTTFDFSGGAENLLVAVDGAGPQTIALSSHITTAAEAATALGALTGARVAVSGGNVVITSLSTGPSSTIAVDASSGANAKLLFASPTTAGGVGSPTAGSYVGASFAAFDFSNGGVDTTLNEDLLVAVDGGADQTITLATNIATPADAVTALAGLTGATARATGGIVVIASTSTGTSSTIAIGGASGTNAVAVLGSGAALAGAANAPACITVGTAGTSIADDNIALVGTAGATITGGGSGTAFTDMATMQGGLSLTGGLVNVDSDSTMALGATTSVELRHNGGGVALIDSAGTALVDSAISLAASDTLELGGGTTFRLTSGADSCTSTLVASPFTVTPADTTNCVLTSAHSAPAAVGACADVASGTATCVYVGVDAVVTTATAESCTSTETATGAVAHYDATNCDLTPGTPGSCAVAAASGGAHSCAYVSTGTTVADEVVSLVGSTRVDITGGTAGSFFRDDVTVQGAVTLEGDVTVAAPTGAVVASFDTVAVDVSTSLAIREGGVDVLLVDSTGTTIADNAINLAGTTITVDSSLGFIMTNPGSAATEGCTSTLASAPNTVTKQDTTLCTLTPGTPATNPAGGSCADAGASATCVYEAATPIMSVTPSGGTVIADDIITLKAGQLNIETTTFNVPVSELTVDGANGVKFIVHGVDGQTTCRGDVLVGGHTPASAHDTATTSDLEAGDRYLRMESMDESVWLTMSGAAADKDSTIRLTDAVGGNAFDLMKDDTVLKIQAENVGGVIELNPGTTSGVLRVNSDRFIIDGASGDTTVRGNVLVGGSSVVGTKTLTLQSNDDGVTAVLSAGGAGAEPSLDLTDGVNTFKLAQTTRFLRLEAQEVDGRIELKPGSSGRLTIGPVGTADPNVYFDTATANTHIGGNVNVEGVSSLNALDVEYGLGTGNSLETINMATGILTSDPCNPSGGCLMTAYSPDSGNTPLPVETIVLDNNRVREGSVVMAHVVEQCNPTTMVTVVSTTTTASTITFTVANLGQHDCAVTVADPLGERFKIAFVVLN